MYIFFLMTWKQLELMYKKPYRITGSYKIFPLEYWRNVNNTIKILCEHVDFIDKYTQVLCCNFNIRFFKLPIKYD